MKMNLPEPEWCTACRCAHDRRIHIGQPPVSRVRKCRFASRCALSGHPVAVGVQIALIPSGWCCVDCLLALRRPVPVPDEPEEPF